MLAVVASTDSDRLNSNRLDVPLRLSSLLEDEVPPGAALDDVELPDSRTTILIRLLGLGSFEINRKQTPVLKGKIKGRFR